MSAQCEVTGKRAVQAPLSFFERYLTIWVLACIALGILLGGLAPQTFASLAAMEYAQINLPVGLLIWLMIIPMLVRIDLRAVRNVTRHARSIGITLFVNWLVKPFSMALLGWIFIRNVFAPYLPADQIDSYIAGLILLVIYALGGFLLAPWLIQRQLHHA